jgi:uncharacterized protein
MFFPAAPGRIWFLAANEPEKEQTMLARIGFTAGTLGLLLLCSSAASAQSFNCRYAKTPDEVLICQDPRLSALDERLSSMFFRLRNTLPPRQRELLDAEQQSWLRERMSCGRDAACIAAVYQRRIRQLSVY